MFMYMVNPFTFYLTLLLGDSCKLVIFYGTSPIVRIKIDIQENNEGILIKYCEHFENLWKTETRETIDFFNFKGTRFI